MEHEITGLLAPPRDPAALAAAIVRLLSDTDLARRVSQAGGRLVRERFGVDRMVESTEACYRSVLAGSGPSRTTT